MSWTALPDPVTHTTAHGKSVTVTATHSLVVYLNVTAACRGCGARVARDASTLAGVAAQANARAWGACTSWACEHARQCCR